MCPNARELAHKVCFPADMPLMAVYMDASLDDLRTEIHKLVIASWLGFKIISILHIPQRRYYSIPCLVYCTSAD